MTSIPTENGTYFLRHKPQRDFCERLSECSATCQGGRRPPLGYSTEYMDFGRPHTSRVRRDMVFAMFGTPLTASLVFTLSSCVKIHMLTTGGSHPEAAASTLVVPDRLTVNGEAELHLLGIYDSYFAMNVTVSANEYAFAEYILVWNWRTGFLASVSNCHHRSYAMLTVDTRPSPSLTRHLRDPTPFSSFRKNILLYVSTTFVPISRRIPLSS